MRSFVAGKELNTQFAIFPYSQTLMAIINEKLVSGKYVDGKLYIARYGVKESTLKKIVKLYKKANR